MYLWLIAKSIGNISIYIRRNLMAETAAAYKYMSFDIYIPIQAYNASTRKREVIIISHASYKVLTQLYY